MTMQQNIVPDTTEDEQSYHIKKLTIDRRRNQRVEVNLLGRFMLTNREEFPCRLLNISPGGCALSSTAESQIGETVIAYIDHIGRVEGKISRHFEEGFAIRFEAGVYKKEKLAEKLTWLANRKILDQEDDRRHLRIVPNSSMSKLLFNDGHTRMCQIIDVSISGASVAIKDRPEVGLELILGRMRGRVVRHHNEGIGIEFIDTQQPNAIKKLFDE